jgi:hypothetical protein
VSVPAAIARHVAPRPVLHLGLTSKVLWIGGPDTGKTTHAKHVALRYPKGAIWDPRGEWTPSFCARHGWMVARDLAGLERAARLSSRVVLQAPQPTRGTDMKAFDEIRRDLGDAFAWWCLDNLNGPAFVYFDEPHTMFTKTDMPAGLAELLRRGHKADHQLAMGWSAWGAREMPNDLENVSHIVAFRPEERNDINRIDSYFGKGWSKVAEALPDYWHMVRQKDPTTRTKKMEVFPPIAPEA